MEENPFPAIMGRVCYHPCETACNRGQPDEAVGINSVERFVGDEAIRQGWRVDVEVPPPESTCWSWVGPSGLAAAYHLARLGHTVADWRGRLDGRRMMRFGIPRYRLPRDVLDAETQRTSISASPRARLQGDRSDRGQGPVRRGLPRRRRAVSAAAPTLPQAPPRGVLDAAACCTTSRPVSSRCSDAGWPCTAAEHRDRRRAHREEARRVRVHRRLPPHQGPRTGPGVGAHRGRGRGHPLQVADHDQGGPGRQAGGRADGASTTPVSPPTGDLDELDADVAPGSRPGIRPVPARGRAGLGRGRCGRRRSGPDDRLPRRVRRWRHGAVRAPPSPSPWATRARPARSTPGLSAAAPEPASSRRLPPSTRSTPGTSPTPSARTVRRLSGPDVSRRSTRWSRATTSRPHCSRRAAACRAWALLQVRQLLRVSGQRRDQAR